MADGEELTLTRENLVVLKPTAADMADALRLMRAMDDAERSNRSAQERLVIGAFGSWFKHRWKRVAAIGTIILSVGGGGWKGWMWLQAEAETQVLERQATVRQADAVIQNTAAVSELSTQQDELTKRVQHVESKLENTTKMNELLLELQLRDPRVKRLVKSDDELKKKIDKIPNVDVQE